MNVKDERREHDDSQDHIRTVQQISRRDFFPVMATVGAGMALNQTTLAADEYPQGRLVGTDSSQTTTGRHPDSEARLILTADTTEIIQLVIKEREARDNQWWHEMRDCYHQDAQLKISWFRGTGWEFVAQSEQLAAQRGHDAGPAGHSLGPIRVHLAGKRAVAAVPLSIQIRDLIDGVESDLTSITRTYYRVELRDDRWWIMGLDTIYQRDTLAPVYPGRRINMDEKMLAEFRLSYRFLSYWWKTTLGRDADQNLPGSDRPESIAALNDEVFSWVGLPKY